MFTILCKCFFLKVTVKAVTKFDNQEASFISGTQTGLPAPHFLPNGRYGGHELWCSQKKITISEMPVESRYADIVKRIHKRMPVNTFVILNEIFIQK
ncbi:hypothetical protein DP285_25040 [Escherichia coli]|nr:hypothetical protein [Escherichia coli]EAA4631840.1 hypothetical protein [Escherichia coli]EEW0003652.1 hypothetical protein [Escherichia coli]EGE3162643.1 hypothetical protein [Escherichia coli]MFB61617.1 hypothetical protein [Escherichia coli]